MQKKVLKIDKKTILSFAFSLVLAIILSIALASIALFW